MTATNRPPSAIDTAERLPADRHQPWFAMGLGLAAWAGIYLTGVNRNLLYLSMLFSLWVVLAFFWRKRRWAVLGLGVWMFLAAVPARVPVVELIDPALRDPTESAYFGAMRADETWSYHFATESLEAAGWEGRLSGRLNVDGINLADLEITVQGRTVSGGAFSTKKYGFLDHVEIPLTTPDRAGLTVGLRARAGSTPKIFLGPEAHRFEIYADAVWLEFKSNGATVIYQAKRVVSPRKTFP